MYLCECFTVDRNQAKNSFFSFCFLTFHLSTGPKHNYQLSWWRYLKLPTRTWYQLHRQTHQNLFCMNTWAYTCKPTNKLPVLSERGVKSEELLMEADSLAAASSKSRGNADLCPAGCSELVQLPSVCCVWSTYRWGLGSRYHTVVMFHCSTGGNIWFACADLPIGSWNLSPRPHANKELPVMS